MELNQPLQIAFAIFLLLAAIGASYLLLREEGLIKFSFKRKKTIIDADERKKINNDFQDLEKYFKKELSRLEKEVDSKHQKLLLTINNLKDKNIDEGLKNELIKQVIDRISSKNIENSVGNLNKEFEEFKIKLSRNQSVIEKLPSIQSKLSKISDSVLELEKMASGEFLDTSSYKALEKNQLLEWGKKQIKVIENLSSNQIDEIDQEIQHIKLRQALQLKRIKFNTTLNLLYGILFSLIAVFLFTYTFFFKEKISVNSTVSTTKRNLDTEVKNSPNILLVFRRDIKLTIFASFISTLAIFFLRAYRKGQIETQYCENERSNMESRILALKTAIKFKFDNKDLKSIINELLKVDRNYPIDKGRSIFGSYTR